MPGAAAAPGVLLAAAGWVWVPDPLPKNCRGGLSKHSQAPFPWEGIRVPPMPGTVLPPSPPPGAAQGTSLADLFPKIGTPPNWGAGCWGSKLQCLMLCGAGRGWLLQPPQPPTLPPGQGTKGEAGRRSVGKGTRQQHPGTQQSPWGTPQLPVTGKGLLFFGETEARAGWASRKMAYPRSPKGTGTGTQASGVPCPALPAEPLCHGRGHRALTCASACLNKLVHTCFCEHTCRLPCISHAHTRVLPQPCA